MAATEKLMIELEPELKNELRELAEKNGQTMTGFIRSMISDRYKNMDSSNFNIDKVLELFNTTEINDILDKI